VLYTQAAAPSALKATFTLNFVKFTSWPAMPPGAAILVCVSSEDSMSEAIAQAFNGQLIDGHPVRTTRIRADADIRDCQLLFISERESRQFAATLNEASRLPILTVSDSDRSTSRGAIVGFFTENDRLRFAINIDALDRSRLKISSRLLTLAKPVHNTDPP